MQRFLISVVVLAIPLAVTGCGDGKLRTAGRIVKGGQPFIPTDGDALTVFLAPILPDGRPPNNYYVAVVDQATGTFKAAGGDLKGMPPGKYRVGMQLLKKGKGEDLFRGKYDTKNSPYVFDVDSGTKEIVIDLDKP